MRLRQIYSIKNLVIDNVERLAVTAKPLPNLGGLCKETFLHQFCQLNALRHTKNGHFERKTLSKHREGSN